jgi:predicted transposase YbfD/YdcC
VGGTPLHLVSAFAAQAGLVLGQRATATKSNEKTAIPELLVTLALEGCIVTIDAMGTQPNIAQAIRDRGADYVLAVKDNQPTLAASIEDFVSAFEAAPGKTPHQFHEVVEKDHGRLEVRRCHVFDPLDCLHAPERWPDLKSFAMVTSERTIKGQTSVDRRFYVSSLVPDAQRMNEAVRRHWRVESVPQAHRKEVRNGLTNCVEATRKMRVGPSGSAFRSGPQTTPSCCGQEPWW